MALSRMPVQTGTALPSRRPSTGCGRLCDFRQESVAQSVSLQRDRCVVGAKGNGPSDHEIRQAKSIASDAWSATLIVRGYSVLPPSEQRPGETKPPQRCFARLPEAQARPPLRSGPLRRRRCRCRSDRRAARGRHAARLDGRGVGVGREKIAQLARFRRWRLIGALDDLSHDRSEPRLGL